MPLSVLRSPAQMRFPRIFRQLEQELATVINVLQPGPLGIIEHKFSAAEVREAKATVERALANWLRNTYPEGDDRVWKHSKNKGST